MAARHQATATPQSSEGVIVLPGGISSQEMIIFLIIAVLLFGSKLPDVMRNLGKAYSQFRRSLTDLQFSVEDTSSSSTKSYQQKSAPNWSVEEDDEEPVRSSAPRFQAPAAEDD